MRLAGAVPATAGLALAAALTLAAPAAAEQAPAATPAPRVGLAPGEPAPALEVRSLADTVGPLEYAREAPTVLLFFLASCPTCKQMIPLWNAAFEKRPADVKVLGILLDREPPGFFQTVPVAFPVVRAADPREAARRFKIARVPVTVRVGADGKVAAVEVGEAPEARLGELFAR